MLQFTYILVLHQIPNHNNFALLNQQLICIIDKLSRNEEGNNTNIIFDNIGSSNSR